MSPLPCTRNERCSCSQLAMSDVSVGVSRKSTDGRVVSWWSCMIRRCAASEVIRFGEGRLTLPLFGTAQNCQITLSSLRTQLSQFLHGSFLLAQRGWRKICARMWHVRVEQNRTDISVCVYTHIFNIYTRNAHMHIYTFICYIYLSFSVLSSHGLREEWNALPHSTSMLKR